jgi:hypothetical protein
MKLIGARQGEHGGGSPKWPSVDEAAKLKTGCGFLQPEEDENKVMR